MLVVSSCCLLFTASALFVTTEAWGQDIRLPLVAAPPPMKFVPRSERAQLSNVRDTKARVRATIELAEARLSRAEELTATQQYDSASAELGIYQGIIEDALYYMNDSKNESNKQRDAYKRLELALRSDCARIEAIRRITPAEYAINIKTICECARNARTEALNAFYGDTVVRELSLEEEKSTGGGNSKDSASGSLKKP
jgi:hypothetical protein